METKLVSKPRKSKTQYSQDFVNAKVKSADSLLNSLSAGSKKRLSSYMHNLSVSRGTEKPLFDNKIKDLIFEYALKPDLVKGELNYLNETRDKDGYLFSRDLKIYSSTQEAMERFAAADHPSFRWNRNYQKALEELRTLVSFCRLRVQKYGSDDDILQALPKTNTHSGYEWILSGRKEKGENIEGLYAKFKGRQNLMMKGEQVKAQPILLGFRTQASGEYEDNGVRTGTCKHKTRVVSMYDLLDIVDELQFSNPFQKWINDQWFYAGGKDDMEIARIINAYSTMYLKFMSIDYSSYDQTISSWLIEDAFSIIRAAFVLTPAEECVFNNVVQRFIHKDFILSEGVLHSDKGVPSGSMFTQIIDSLVNVLVVKTYFNSIGKSCRMIAMGDDNAIFCDLGVDIEHLASYLRKNFGLIVKTDDKSNEGDVRMQDVKFLSRYWTKGGTWRHPWQLLSRLLFPERRREYGDEVQPEHVLTGYILTYKVGMTQLIDVPRFVKEHPVSRSFVVDHVDSRYLPGYLAYVREYTLGRST